jgi:hypothetical protein
MLLNSLASLVFRLPFFVQVQPPERYSDLEVLNPYDSQYFNLTPCFKNLPLRLRPRPQFPYALETITNSVQINQRIRRQANSLCLPS